MKILYGALLSLSLLSVMTASCRSAPGWERIWPESLHSARNEPHLPETGKAVIHEINKVRTNPKAYANYLKRERRYYSGKIIKRPGARPVRTREGRAALEACIAALEKSAAAEALTLDENLCRAAGLLAAEQKKTGVTGHVCADGRTIKDRIMHFSSDRYMKMAENISYGSREARAIVIRLLIDDGIPSRGHRLNLMNPSFTHCGVAITAHPVYRHVCVIDFAAY